MKTEIINKLKYLINKKKSLIEICNELELKDYEVIGLVELMKQDGLYARIAAIQSNIKRGDDVNE